ncbi:MAG TPA: hypothetical protein VKB51_02165 [bacterium]|nr:hypothetical protein [bacterium]
MIELSARRRADPPERRPPQVPEWEGEPGDLLSLPFLVERLSFPSNQVRMWAAFQLVDRWQDACPRYIDKLWEAPQDEIRESAIGLIGKYQMHTYAFPLMRAFSSREHPFSHAAGVALGRLGYEPVGKLLRRWFHDTVTNAEATPIELEAATEALLFFDEAGHWEEVHAHLGACHQNHAFFSTLFAQLCLHAQTPRHVRLLAEAYGPARELFNDVHLTQHLLATIGRANLSRFLQARLNGGYRLNAVYQECLKVLGWEDADPETRNLMDSLGQCGNTRDGLERFVPLAGALLARLAPEAEATAFVSAFMQGCTSWLGKWEDSILKVREVEFHLLTSLPLVALLTQVEAQCLAAPETEALHITRIYQSPLLSPQFMSRVLNLLSRGDHSPDISGLSATVLAGWVRDEEKDALWKLYTGQLEGVDYPLEQVLPQPWEYPVADLMPRLVALLEERLPGYVTAERSQAVDYCLEVFRRAGTTALVERLLPHFEPLINHHYHAFVELMTHLPDVRFLQPLVNHYRAGEEDLLRLIHFICDVHRRPYPELPARPDEEDEQEAAAGQVRLLCRTCGGAYQYTPGTVFVDEERIEQRQILTAREVWTPTRFECKKCGSPVPFDPDARFLNDLFTELLAARLFPPGTRDEAALSHVRLIQFPRLEGGTLNPAHFLKEVERALSACETPGQETPYLLELGRFQMEIGEADAAKQTFQRIVAGPSKCPQALYYLGVLAFQEKNLYEARLYFSRLIQGSTREDFDNELDNPVDMAHHYLKLLDKREFKRSHFHLISS